MTRRVLFVDDDPNVLEGLKHRLHRQRKHWEMHFAESGKAALELLARQPVDVIVTDMRMPQMDGAALLRQVQESYPHVVRIVLSGHAELETALRAVPVAHQFLSKPSEPGVIERVVERACNLQSLVNDATVRQTVGKIEHLPSLPRVYSQLITTLSNENATCSDVAALLRQDLALCAKILQVVNSAFFRLSRSITKIEEAVRYLGLTTIKHLALAVELFQHGSEHEPSVSSFSLDALQQHSLLVAEATSSFFVDKQAQEDAFVVGLLHDIGKLLIAVELPHKMAEVVAEAKASGCSANVAEESVWGVSHAEVGGYLLGLWGLPYPIIEAVANHHTPGRVGVTDFGILAALHTADALVHELQPIAAEERGARLDLEFLERLNVADRVEDWRAKLQTHLGKLGLDS